MPSACLPVCSLEFSLLFPHLPLRCWTVSDVAWANIDSRVPKAIFSALGDHMPGRIGAGLLLRPPWYARLVVPVIKLGMKRKMAARLHVLPGDPDQVLQPYLDDDNILEEHGGRLPDRHKAWLEQRGVRSEEEPGSGSAN